MSEQAIDSARAESVRKALGYYKVMSIVAGIALFILCIVVFIHYVLGNAKPSETWSPIHGILYFVYVLATANLGFKVGWSLPRMIRIMLVGFVPVLPFIVEPKVAREVEGQLATGSLSA
jgi:integral membrane protein